MPLCRSNDDDCFDPGNPRNLNRAEINWSRDGGRSVGRRWCSLDLTQTERFSLSTAIHSLIASAVRSTAQIMRSFVHSLLCLRWPQSSRVFPNWCLLVAGTAAYASKERREHCGPVLELTHTLDPVGSVSRLTKKPWINCNVSNVWHWEQMATLLYNTLNPITIRRNLSHHYSLPYITLIVYSPLDWLPVVAWVPSKGLHVYL